MPVLALLPFIDRNFDEKFAVLRRGSGYEEGGYMTVKMALEDGAVVMSYGYVMSICFYPSILLAVRVRRDDGGGCVRERESAAMMMMKGWVGHGTDRAV